MKRRLFLFTVIIFAISAITAISFAQRKPDAEKPITGDFTFGKILIIPSR